MNLPFCSQLPEVEAAVREGKWPERAAAELRSHAASCRHCQQLLLVAGALRQERHAAMPMARLVPPGILWWKARLQRQRLSVERSIKPVVVAERLALIATLLGAVVCIALRGRQLAGWLDSTPHVSIGDAVQTSLSWISGDGFTWLLPVAAAGTLAILAGVAAFLVVRAE